MHPDCPANPRKTRHMPLIYNTLTKVVWIEIVRYDLSINLKLEHSHIKFKNVLY